MVNGKQQDWVSLVKAAQTRILQKNDNVSLLSSGSVQGEAVCWGSKEKVGQEVKPWL